MNTHNLQTEIEYLLLNDVNTIISKSRSENMTIIEEKRNGDSTTNADIEIGRLLSDKLKALIPASLVVEEESFHNDVFAEMNTNQYIWIIDPIDGTKAFRTTGNNEYCVAVALLENMQPILSIVYAPEYEHCNNKGLLFIANSEGAKLNGNMLNFDNNITEHYCINHIHRDIELNEFEKKISGLCGSSQTIRAYAGHSTLLQICLVAAEAGGRVFTRRGANIWDIVQGAFVVEKAGGKVTYDNGKPIFPINIDALTLDGENHLLMNQILVCSKSFLNNTDLV
jgi:myo-inositol-1(or 4)-monophosphatase